jgi:hypothetical protein
MKLSAQFSFWMGIVFTLFSGAMAFSNLSSSDAGATEAELAAAHGYAVFWLFFAAFGAIMVVVSWLMAKGKLGGDRDD